MELLDKEAMVVMVLHMVLVAVVVQEVLGQNHSTTSTPNDERAFLPRLLQEHQ